MSRNFGKDVLKARKKRKLTQEELAKQVNLSRSLLAKYESGQVLPTDDNIIVVCDFLNLKSTKYLRPSFSARVLEVLSGNVFNFFSFFVEMFLLVFPFLPIFRYKRFDIIGSTHLVPVKVEGITSLLRINYLPCTIMTIIYIVLMIFAFSIHIFSCLKASKKKPYSLFHFSILIVAVIVFLIDLSYALAFIQIQNLECYINLL